MEKNSNKGLKKLVLLLLLFVGLGASVTAGAYWASSFTAKNPTNATGDLTVTIGEGKPYALETTLALGSQSDDTVLDLVPTFYKDDTSTDTRLISIGGVWSVVSKGEYTLGSATGTLSAVINSYSLGSLTETEIDAMFTIDVTTNNVKIEFGSSEQIVVSVVFHTEPESKDLYDLVALQTLTINITLSVEAD